jgi:hypothetical protein
MMGVVGYPPAAWSNYSPGSRGPRERTSTVHNKSNMNWTWDWLLDGAFNEPMGRVVFGAQIATLIVSVVGLLPSPLGRALQGGISRFS